MSSLEFKDVTVRFGHGKHAFDAVRGINLTVPAGQVVGLVGESGSGKSTVARSAVGLVEATSGQIVLGGVDVTRARGATAHTRRQIQMVFQDPYSCLDPLLTVGQSIEEGISARWHRARAGSKPASGERLAEVRSLLEMVHLDPDRVGDLPSTLSGGQRQRVALARALAAKPQVLVADEITSALDVSVQGSILNLLHELQQSLDLTVLFISHNLAIVRHMCDQVAVMYHGRIVEQGETLGVLESPQHTYTRELLAAVPQVGVPLFSGDASYI